jgi:two-component system, OmpR family, phosphate regulon sensor histidine kinase PhoR
MSVLNSLTLLFNGITLALSLSFLLIIISQDARRELNQLFAAFLLLVTLWNGGSLLAQATVLIDADPTLIRLAISLMETGFTGSSIAIYTLTAVLVRVHTRRFRWLAFIGLILVMFYQVLLVVSNAPLTFQTGEAGTFTYYPQPLSAVFYLIFDTATFYLAWRYHRKIRSRGLVIGILLFVTGQSLGLLNPELRALSFSINISSFATLLISFSILRQEIITPLAERVTQIETMHRVSVAITSQISIDHVLNQIAVQAVGWLDADGAGIFLLRGEELELVTVYNLPTQFIGARVRMGEGIAGTVAQTQQSIHVESYHRDWRGKPDLPLARETFGAVICAPLVYGGDVTGVLMVIAGQQGRMFSPNDVHLLEMLGAQAAVAIAHSQLFADQRKLTHEVEAARSQLETVLLSTENPVIAVNRNFHLIFANPAARTLFTLDNEAKGKPIFNLVPREALPAQFSEVLDDVRHNRTHTYEVTLNNGVYLCHVAAMGRPRVAGWVGVLNDVTELKELDRLKSEMVRMTSHDLKNPLQAAMANLELLRDDLSSAVQEIAHGEVQTSLDTIEKQLERMYRIINGILDLERIKTGAQVREACSPDILVSETIDELQHLADDQHIMLKSYVEPDTPEFMGDAEQFKRALINLVENAIKFTKPNGVVMILARREQTEVVFEIKDTGIGIPKELYSQVFERFFRGRQKGVEHISGSGLGLSLVKAIVENHGGRVWLESEEGIGTTFYVSLPAITTPKPVIA